MNVSTSHVEHMNFVLSDGEQDAITAHNHLSNFFGELIVFRGDRKSFRNEAKLFGN